MPLFISSKMLSLQMLYAEKVSCTMFDVSCLNVPSNTCDFLILKVIQNTSRGPDFLRLEIVMSKFQNKIKVPSQVCS